MATSWAFFLKLLDVTGVFGILNGLSNACVCVCVCVCVCMDVCASCLKRITMPCKSKIRCFHYSFSCSSEPNGYSFQYVDLTRSEKAILKGIY